MKHQQTVRITGVTLLVLVTLGFFGALAPATETGPDFPVLNKTIMTKLDNAAPDEMVSCIVVMREDYPKLLNAAPAEIITTYRRIAADAQRPLLDELAGRPVEAQVGKTWWLLNGFQLDATPSVIREIAGRGDVLRIRYNGTVQLIDPTPNNGPDTGPRGIEWGVQMVMADSCWADGFDGNGIIVGHTDTGVDDDHPALSGKFAGYWHDAINGQPNPYDDHGHGTHTMGTILGGDGFGSFTNDIGVAPGATWISAKMLDGSGSGSYDQCLDGMQFIADCKADTDVKMMSASWSTTDTTEDMFFDICQTYKDIGILPIFANGNEGPGSGTVGVPGNYPLTMGVGATDSGDNIANFSSRGPAPSISPWNNTSLWFRPDWDYIKPDISAPGANVRSCVPGGGYNSWNGTSMATPHVAGACAILLQKNPNLEPQQLYDILQDGLDQPGGGSYPNNNYGWGRLNIWNSLQEVPPLNRPWIVVTGSEISDPPPGGNGNGRIDPGEEGEYILTLKNAGGGDAYNVSVSTTQSDDYYIDVENGELMIGDLPSGETGSNSDNPTRLFAHYLTPEGHRSALELMIAADGDSIGFADTLSVQFMVGTPPPPYEIATEDFEYSGGGSFTDSWETEWEWNHVSGTYHSAYHSAFSGNAGDDWSYLTMRNPVDLSFFAEPKLSYWLRYDFDQVVFMHAKAEVSSDGVNWNSLWDFHFYEEPSSTDWIKKGGMLSNYNTENCRLRFGVKGFDFFNTQTHMWIDDLLFYADSDNEPPYFLAVAELADTEELGPFPVSAEVTDLNDVAGVSVFCSIDNGVWQEIELAASGNIYSGSIPAQSGSCVIDYYYEATDSWIVPNSGSFPLGAPADGSFTFEIISYANSGPGNGIGNSFTVINHGAGDHSRFSFTLGQQEPVSLKIYDARGQLVRSLSRDETFVAGTHCLTWDGYGNSGGKVASGIYFVNFRAGNFNATQKVVIVR